MSPARLFRPLAIAALLALATTARAEPDLSAPSAAEAVAAGKLTLIDIRTPPEWKETGVAKGAQLLDMNHPQGAPGFTKALLEKLGGNKEAPVALICRTGNRTTMVQRYLQAQGFTNVINVKEGMAGSGAGPGWLKRGLPVDTCATLKC